MAGVVTILLIDLDQLMTIVPAPAGTEHPTITTPLKLLGLVQPSLLLALAVFTGVALAHRVRLSAPFAEALAEGGDAFSALKRQTLAGVVGGVAGGASILLVALLFRSSLSFDTLNRIDQLGKIMPLPMRFLYGGITEELLLRWGFMTLLVWLGWRLFQRTRNSPTAACFVGAIVLSSVVFGIGHLPLAIFLIPEKTVALFLYVIAANSVFGFIAGYLYWKKGLEAAIIAHMFVHLVLVLAGA